MRTGIILHKASHIVNLQAQRMTNPVRHKWPSEIVFHHRLFAHVRHNLVLTQQFGNALMKLNVVIDVAGPRFQGADKCQLFVIHVFDQMREIVVRVCRPGTGEVGRVAVVLSARIQQEATHLGRCAVIQFGVVQHGCMLVQRHDIAVRHVGIPMARRGQVRLIDIELAHPGQEGFMSRLMTVHRRFLRFTHAGKFIVGLI
ncbi:hypothetical protein D3C76_1224130 [compost metagenome]